MTAYDAAYADLYDLFYADKPYAAEAAFLDSMFRADPRGPRERLLDVACGTGRHAVEFAELGWDVVGVDRSRAMLDQARGRTSARLVRFIEQDMTAMDLAEEPFDAVTCLFDSIGYAVSNEAIAATLQGIRRHLRPDGLLGLEFWHAAAMYKHHDPLRVRRWTVKGAQILRTSSTSLDALTSTGEVDYAVYRLGRDGRYAEWHERHRNRYFQVQEMALLLNSAGFALVQSYAGYSADEVIDESTWHVVAIARASNAGGG